MARRARYGPHRGCWPLDYCIQSLLALAASQDFTWLPKSARVDSLARSRYAWYVLLPFDRDKLRKRNRADVLAERAIASACTPEQGLTDAIELSQVVRSLAQATAGEQSADDLAEKARLYVLPLRVAQRP